MLEKEGKLFGRIYEYNVQNYVKPILENFTTVGAEFIF